MVVPFASAKTVQVSGTSPLAGKNVIFQPYSIDRIWPDGKRETLVFPTTMGSAHVGNCWVDIPTPGFKVVDTELVGSNDTTLVYRIDAESDLPINLYTKTLATDLAYQYGTQTTWCDYLHYRSDCLACGFNIDDPGINYNKWFSSSSSIYPNFYQHAAIAYSTVGLIRLVRDGFYVYGYDINSAFNRGFDEYENLVVNVGYNNPGPVTFQNTDNTSIQVVFSTTSWQVTGMYATEDFKSYPLGTVKTEYINVGKEMGNLHVYSASEMLANTKQFMTQGEQDSYYTNQIAGKIGWAIAGQENGLTVQNGLNDGPTMGNALITAGNRIEEINAINQINLGYHIRPNIVKDTQLLSVTHGRVDFCTKAVFPAGPGITLLQPGATEQIKRDLGVQAENNIIRQPWKASFSFFVTVVPKNIPTTAILGLPKMEQYKMVIDASIGGQTDLSEYIDDASPLGNLVRNTGGIWDEILSWIIPIVIIALVAIAVYFVFKRIGTPKQ